jgi:hypothetical protein
LHQEVLKKPGSRKSGVRKDKRQAETKNKRLRDFSPPYPTTDKLVIKLDLTKSPGAGQVKKSLTHRWVQSKKFIFFSSKIHFLDRF